MKTSSMAGSSVFSAVLSEHSPVLSNTRPNTRLYTLSVYTECVRNDFTAL